MSTKSISIAILFFVIFSIAAVNVVLWTDYPRNKTVIDHSTYEGRVYLQEEDYESFKQLLADRKDVKIERLTVLASNNPLIDFKVIVEGNGTFPYGQREVSSTRRFSATVAVSFISSLILVMIGYAIGGSPCLSYY